MRLGVSSYTYNWWAGAPGYPLPERLLTPSKLIDEAADLNVSVVQIADNLPLDVLSPAELHRLRTYAGERGITLELGTRGILPYQLTRYLEIAHQLGATFVRTLVDSRGHEPSVEEAIALLKDSVPAFENSGVILGIENHDRMRAAELRRIIEAVGSPHLGVCLDTANSLGCGEGISEVAATLAHLVVNLHVKDFRIRRFPHGKGFTVEGTPAGQGQLNVPELLSILGSRANKHISVILELWSLPEDNIEISVERERAWARESVAYLRLEMARLSNTECRQTHLTAPI